MFYLDVQKLKGKMAEKGYTPIIRSTSERIALRRKRASHFAVLFSFLRSMAPPFQIEPAALGFDLVNGGCSLFGAESI